MNITTTRIREFMDRCLSRVFLLGRQEQNEETFTDDQFSTSDDDLRSYYDFIEAHENDTTPEYMTWSRTLRSDATYAIDDPLVLFGDFDGEYDMEPELVVTHINDEPIDRFEWDGRGYLNDAVGYWLSTLHLLAFEERYSARSIYQPYRILCPQVDDQTWIEAIGELQTETERVYDMQHPMIYRFDMVDDDTIADSACGVSLWSVVELVDLV